MLNNEAPLFIDKSWRTITKPLQWKLFLRCAPFLSTASSLQEIEHIYKTPTSISSSKWLLILAHKSFLPMLDSFHWSGLDDNISTCAQTLHYYYLPSHRRVYILYSTVQRAYNTRNGEIIHLQTICWERLVAQVHLHYARAADVPTPSPETVLLYAVLLACEAPSIPHCSPPLQPSIMFSGSICIKKMH